MRIPGAVARVGLAPTGPTVIQVYQAPAYPCFTKSWDLLALDIDHESDAAGVMLVPGIIKTLLGVANRSIALGTGLSRSVWFVIGPTSLAS
jgi:hypothetical protein